ncbi:MAG: DNA polymerase III subunit alpha [Sphaerochaeta sp.]|jgi:DNA polymerase-3 subunit alpha|nr:DNA polymerase III subunit alpha [Sphaerochaeta sp.]MCI2045993.1 DNA polymerase III subunit alpha [Sphaerochaeta sp.]MCI2076425.1 DNA polymerase III subunit alpha [Sphaerochaeta sp.]
MEEKQTDQQQEQPISDDELLAQQAEEEQEIEEEEETAAAAPPQPQAPAEEKAADELPDPGFVHLHDHSDFSLLDGAAKIDRYVAKAKSYGMRSLALTDHGNMFGALRFYKACKEAGINPIIGCEFYCNPADHTFIPEPGDHNHDHRYHLILLAMNEKGYHNLMELNSAAWTEGFYYKPRIDDKLLEEHNEGLICLSACLAGEILQNLLGGQYEEAKRRALWFNSVFDDGRYYLEMQDHGLEEQKLTNPLLVKLHEETGIPLVCTNDIHYIEKDDAEAQDILLCIGTNSKRDDPNRMRFPSSEFYFKSPEEMKQLFSWCPEAIENTNRIAQRCDIQIHFPGPKLPVFQVPDGFKDTAEYLRYLANEGLKNRYGTITPQLQQRLDYELDIIIKMDFQGYFLIVMDYIRWAKNHGIPVGPGRGSGAGSLVAYSINITDVDPMKYNLLFERFLNPERVSMPDFDVDFCFERRKEVIQYVTEHYGKNRVAQIATFGTLKAKAVVKDCARVLDIPFDESTRICKLIPDDPKMTLAKAFAQNPELGQLEAKGGVYATLFSVARKLEGMNRNTSTHAAGVVIGQEPLVNYVPLYRDPKTGNQATQYTMDQIEECGLVKMDFLGLKTLTLIKHTVDLIHKKKPNFDINAIDDHDPKTFRMLCNGDSTAVFQFESSGMQQILRQAHPDSIEDIVALNALYRPGPMQYIPTFINCKNGKQPIHYPDPDLKPVLENTYGVIVYQEQVMKVAQVIAGYSLGQADILRRIMGKKKAEKLAHELPIFEEGAQKLGRTKAHADEIFEMLKPFAGYGFNKSHAVAYSLVAYQTAFLKANYPAEFLAANLTNEMGNPDKFNEYLEVAKEMGLKIQPPDINKSECYFTVADGVIVYGLAGIKNVGEEPVKLLVAEREKNGPFTSFVNYLMRLDGRAYNSKLLESLIKAGAFDSLGVNRPTLLANIEGAVAFATRRKEATAYGQISLFDESTEPQFDEYQMEMKDDWALSEKLETEKQVLGFYVSGHPLDQYREVIKKCVVVDTSKPEQLPFGRDTNIVASLTTLRQFTTKKETVMAFLTLTDRNASFSATMFPKTYAQYKDILQQDGIYGFTGKFDNSRGMEKLSFLIDKVYQDPNQLPPIAVSECHIEMDKQMCTKDVLEKLHDSCLEYPGQIRLYLTVNDQQRNVKTTIKCGREFSVSYSDVFTTVMKDSLPIESIYYD